MKLNELLQRFKDDAGTQLRIRVIDMYYNTLRIAIITPNSTLLDLIPYLTYSIISWSIEWNWDDFLPEFDIVINAKKSDFK